MEREFVLERAQDFVVEFIHRTCGWIYDDEADESAEDNVAAVPGVDLRAELLGLFVFPLLEIYSVLGFLKVAV